MRQDFAIITICKNGERLIQNWLKLTQNGITEKIRKKYLREIKSIEQKI